MASYHTKEIVLAALFAGLTAVGAFIKIPFLFVPFTLQTLFTALAGTFLSPRFAVLSQLSYLILGLAGLPVFVNGGGAGYILQPTFGYLAGLPLAAFFISTRIKRSQNQGYAFLFVANFIGLSFVLVLGGLWLFVSLNLFTAKGISINTAIFSGTLIFIPITFLKCFLVTAIARSLGHHLDST